MKPRLLASIALTGLVLSAAPGARGDSVYLIEGTTLKGNGVVGGRVNGAIEKETPTEIAVGVGGSTVSVPLDQVERVGYDSPPSLVRAASLANGSDQARAAEEFAKAAEEAKDAPFALQAAKFGQAKALASLALAEPERADQVLGLLQSFLKAYPNSRHKGPALELVAKLKALKGDYAGAREAASQMAGIGWIKNRANILEAEINIKDGKADAAIGALDGMLGGAPKGSALLRDALLTKAVALAALKRTDEASKIAQEVIDAANPDDAATQALAYNTLGDCLIEANKPKDALLAYLHTDILFAAEKEQHARALARIAQAWRVLKRDDRANDTLARLQEQYPKSPWLKAARGTD